MSLACASLPFCTVRVVIHTPRPPHVSATSLCSITFTCGRITPEYIYMIRVRVRVKFVGVRQRVVCNANALDVSTPSLFNAIVAGLLPPLNVIVHCCRRGPSASVNLVHPVQHRPCGLLSLALAATVLSRVTCCFIIIIKLRISVYLLIKYFCYYYYYYYLLSIARLGLLHLLIYCCCFY